MDRHSKIPYQNLHKSPLDRHFHRHHLMHCCHLVVQETETKGHILGSPHGNSEPCGSPPPPLHRPQWPSQQEAAGPWRLGSQAVSLEGVARITRGLCILKTLVSNHGYLICPAPQCQRLSRLIITTHYSSKSGPAHRLPLGWCQTGMTT